MEAYSYNLRCTAFFLSLKVFTVRSESILKRKKMEPYAILLQAIFAVYVPTTMRSIANARGTFVPHVPVIVKPLNVGNEEGEVAIVLLIDRIELIAFD